MNANLVFDDDEARKCTNGKCDTEIQSLSKQISDLEKEVIKAKELYHESLCSNLKKDLMIEQLEAELELLKYGSFRNDFSEEVITALKLIEDSEQKDTAFIQTAMKYLYRDNLEQLKGKTYSGRTKEAVSPKKVEILTKLFNERIRHLNDQDKANRKRYLGRAIKNAIENINKSN